MNRLITLIGLTELIEENTVRKLRSLYKGALLEEGVKS
jgi:hypothetical protein